jgi:hypothetical protein
MAASRYSFDVEIRHGKRWVIDCVRTLEHEALNRANELFANPKCAGARVIRTWKRPDGVAVDTEIFCETREVAEDTTVRITPVDAVNVKCETLKDYFGFKSRQTMARIFREYLAKVAVTPTEILHNLRHLKRLSEKDGLIRAAVDMVATLQGRPGEQDTKTRRDELVKALDGMFARAREIDPASLPKLDRKFSDVMASLGPDIDSDRRDYLVLAALSRDLSDIPNWVGKLEMLCGMAEAESAGAALDLLDGVIADVLATDVIQEIIGLQVNLAATIRALLDVADGIVPTTRSGTAAITARLCQLLADRKLPASRRCVVERAHRALRAPHPLKPNDPAEEPAELRKIIARVLTPTGLHSGPDTAHALTLRFARTVEQGGKTGRRVAIKGLFLAMPDMAIGVLYLCEAARSDLAREHLADMEAVFDVVLKTKSIAEFCDQNLDFQGRMARATAAHHAMASSPYSSLIRERITGHIDDLLERFVVDEQIIEKLDQPGSPLRDRALRLVRFCGSGLLPNGKALTKARERVVALLKQPDFPTRFVAGIDDPVAAQAALRDFFLLLKSNGVHGG